MHILLIIILVLKYLFVCLFIKSICMNLINSTFNEKSYKER